MGLMLSVLIFCVGVIEAIAWTKYLHHTCTPCSHHRQIPSKSVWPKRKSFSKIRSNSEGYALHHESKCVCSEIHKVDIAWPRSFSLDTCRKECHNVEAATETSNHSENVSTISEHASPNGVPRLTSKDSEQSIDELEEIDFKDNTFPAFVRQYSEDSWCAKKRSDSEFSIESFDSFKTSKVNICWPRPFTSEDLRVIKKRSDSELSVEEVEEFLRVPHSSVLRVIKSRSPSDSESSSDEKSIQNINDKNENSNDVAECSAASAQRGCDIEVSNLSIEPECKLELKRGNCHVFENCSNLIGTPEINDCLPEIPEPNDFVFDMPNDEVVKEESINSNNDSPRCPIQENARASCEHERSCDDLQTENNHTHECSDFWKENSDNGVLPALLVGNTDCSDNRSIVNCAVPSRTSETMDEISEISEKDFKELSEHSCDISNMVTMDVTSKHVIDHVVPSVERTNDALVETLNNHGPLGSRSHLSSDSSEGSDLCYYEGSDSIGSQYKENEDIDGDHGSNINYDELSSATRSDYGTSEISGKERSPVSEAQPNDGLVYLCKAKESKEPPFEGCEQVHESNTVFLNAVGSDEQDNNFQRFNNKDDCEVGVSSNESYRRSDQLTKTSEELETTQSEVDKAFWLIFSGEYTKAMSKDWHSGHFCCWQCDESLTGQRYVLRDDHPYCVKCYESVFANGCEECNKIIGIDSKDLSYKDKHWHEACFLCNKCRVSLVDKQFGSKVDKIYCGNCYDQQFASRCDGCGQIFRAGTKKMEYKTRQWHEPCFCCCVCKTPIGTKSFIPREQEIYCATCYEEKFATRCVKCNKIITSGGVTYKNEPWHRECFTCTNCNTSLAGQRFTSRDEKPYCADCFGELFAKRCTSCCKPITGIGGTRFISFEDRHWHNDCFICASCKTSLVGRGFITDGDDIICPDCAKQKLM